MKELFLILSIIGIFVFIYFVMKKIDEEVRKKRRARWKTQLLQRPGPPELSEPPEFQHPRR